MKCNMKLSKEITECKKLVGFFGGKEKSNYFENKSNRQKLKKIIYRN